MPFSNGHVHVQSTQHECCFRIERNCYSCSSQESATHVHHDGKQPQVICHHGGTRYMFQVITFAKLNASCLVALICGNCPTNQ